MRGDRPLLTGGQVVAEIRFHQVMADAPDLKFID